MQQLILSFNNRAEVLELPWPLQEWSIDNPHNTYSFDTINQGEVLAIGKKRLKSLTINSTFPAHEYPFLLTKSFPEPEVCVQMINKWRLSGKPIRVAIVDTDINLAMAIEDFQVAKESMDGSGDIVFSLILKEYSYLNVERSKLSNTGTDLKNRPKEKVLDDEQRRHNVKQGDTLWDLADKYLGDGNRWQEIAKANGVTNPLTLQIGLDLKIPAKETSKA